MTEAIRIEGLNQFRANLKQMDKDLPKALRLAFNSAADIVVGDAQPKVPTKSGKARKTVKAKSTQKFSRVSGGGKQAPYYPWLDFGGQIGARSGKARGKRGKRPFIKDGRYIYSAYYSNRDKYGEVLQGALVQVATDAGIGIE